MINRESIGKEIAISLKNVSKCYKRYARPLDRLKETLLPGKSYSQQFWALKDISFEVMKGETMGFIGRNGAGKSTLLQLICGTLTPTSGEVKVNGRVAALLELGAGFNPEFTGRENVYINGAIMGLSRQELNEQFEQIAAFADVGDYIDQPVKTYSSGMYVRLAFSSAIHIKPDILIVDEALSVGDMFFQAKCIARMRQMMETGVTVLFVSHDIGTVRGLCKKCVWLENGKVMKAGIAENITAEYSKSWIENINLNSSSNSSDIINSNKKSLCYEEQKNRRFVFNKKQGFSQDVELFRTGTGAAKFRDIEVLDSHAKHLENKAEFNQEIKIKAYIEIYEDCQNIVINYHIRNKQGQEILGNDSLSSGTDIYTKKWIKGNYIAISFTTKLPIIHGIYSINLLISSFKDKVTFSDVKFLDWIENAYVFEMNMRKPFVIFDFVHIENEVKYEVI